MRAIRWFVIGACFPVVFCAIASLAEGKNPMFALFAVNYSLPSAIVFSLLGLAWDLWDESSLRDEAAPKGPINAEPPPRSPRGPSRPGRS